MQANVSQQLEKVQLAATKVRPALSCLVLDHLSGVLSQTNGSRGKGGDWTKLLFYRRCVCCAGSLCTLYTKRGVEKGRVFQQNRWLV